MSYTRVIHLAADLRCPVMDLSVLALALRAAAALVDLAGHTVTGVLEQWADRVDPPGLAYAGFDVRLDGLGPRESVDGYYVGTGGRA